VARRGVSDAARSAQTARQLGSAGRQLGSCLGSHALSNDSEGGGAGATTHSHTEIRG